ncbi:hypothetical protein ACXWO5_11105, partial [Streptococcus pyogenes]
KLTGNTSIENSKLKNAIEIVKNGSKSEIDKSDSIIKAYEDYLYSLNKEAFDKYWNVRKRTVKWNPQKDKQAAEAEKQL